MRARAYPLLEQTIEDWLRGYLLNRVDKYTPRISWVVQRTVDGPVEELERYEDIDRHVRQIAEEAADHIMTGICEAFTFTDDEAVVPMEEEPLPIQQANLVSSPAPGVDKIIELLEQEKAEAVRLTDASVDEQAWADAAAWEERASYIDLLIRRIKAEDFPPLADAV